jgi:transketolase
LNLKQQIVEMAYVAKEGHIPSALSILDIVEVLYSEILTKDDRFVLSKGHGALALYVVLNQQGILPDSALKTFMQFDGVLGGHPDRNKIRGVLCSTGSLGHGLPQAVGMALAKKIKGEPGRVFCLIGDGECNEGSVWESLLIASHHKLNNLVVIVDHNHSTDRALDLGNIRYKFDAFGFTADRIDGHNFETLRRYLDWANNERPTAIIAETIKGNGCIRMLKPEWHHRVPTLAELNEILEELR